MAVSQGHVVVTFGVPWPGETPINQHLAKKCTGGCVVERRICNREVPVSNLGRDYFAPRSTQPSIPPGSGNEYQLRLGRQRQAWLILIADETQGVTMRAIPECLRDASCGGMVWHGILGFNVQLDTV